MTLQELNNTYFELYGDLYEARSLLSDKQYKITSEALLESYKDDLEVCLQQKALAVGRERFELRFKVRNWLPRRVFLFWNNKVAKQLLKTYVADFEAELKRLEENAIPPITPASSSDTAQTLPVPQSRDVETL